MRLSQAISLLDAKVHYGVHRLDLEIRHGFSSDMMGDVLSFVKKDNILLITGLNNSQVIRTAEMLDVKAVIMVRGKIPSEEVVSLAREMDIVIASTSLSLFETSGILYLNGLLPIKL